ncbi:MAG: hypothetical protein ACHQJ6_04220 [Candidatus Berkiellales bacterium]
MMRDDHIAEVRKERKRKERKEKERRERKRKKRKEEKGKERKRKKRKEEKGKERKERKRKERKEKKQLISWQRGPFFFVRERTSLYSTFSSSLIRTSLTNKKGALFASIRVPRFTFFELSWIYTHHTSRCDISSNKEYKCYLI